MGAAYRAALAEGLRERFGLQYREAGRGQWEVAGVPEALLAAFSKRSEQILAYAGAGASSAAGPTVSTAAASASSDRKRWFMVVPLSGVG